MKRIILIISLVLMFFAFKNAHASLPELQIPPTITPPHTFSYAGSQSGLINMNNDGNYDFHMYFSGPFGMFIYPASGNHILKESSNSYGTMLPFGTNIGATPPSGSVWETYSQLCYFPQAPVSPNLTASHLNGVNSGYLGVSYYSSGDLYYGWINIEIDNDDETVTVWSVGSGEAPSAAASAGLGDPYGPTAVPIPLIASIAGFLIIGTSLLIRRKKK
jgi:hypothetical protein